MSSGKSTESGDKGIYWFKLSKDGGSIIGLLPPSSLQKHEYRNFEFRFSYSDGEDINNPEETKRKAFEGACKKYGVSEDQMILMEEKTY